MIDIIKDELARQGRSREWLAEEARISIHSLNKALAGTRPLPERDVVRVEDVLGLSLRVPANTGGIASDRLGSYTRNQMHWAIGDFVMVRELPATDTDFYASAVAVAWDGAQSCLRYNQSEFFDGSIQQQGTVALGALTGQISLQSAQMGETETIMLSRPAADFSMTGVQLASRARKGVYRPTATRVVFLKQSDTLGWKNGEFGRIDAGHPRHDLVRKMFAREFNRS